MCGMRVRATIWFWGVLSLALAATGTGLARTARAQTQSGSTEKQERSAPQGNDSIQPKKSASDSDSDATVRSHPGWKGLGEDFLLDQKAIWSSPAKIRATDAQWLVPLGGITAGLFVTDSSFSTHLSNAPGTISRYKNVSNAGIGALVGGAG